MIVVDTSALMAILMGEPESPRCKASLKSARRLLISATTVAEALIVAARRGVREEMAKLIDSLGIEVVPVTRRSAETTADAYDLWGKGVHPASLNLADCFAYALATSENCPLLFVGNDFARTDIVAA